MDHKTIYLTIDDFPSSQGEEKIEFLASHHIPAVIYARGECLKKHLNMAVRAIELGYLIGNHSYYHPYFSQLSFQECRWEIDQTEILIDQAYHQAGKIRPLKTIRYPFGDPACPEIEAYLKEQNFRKAILLHEMDTQSVSVPWSIDTLDYKVRLTQEPHLLIEHLSSIFETSDRREEVVLLHDFDHNQEAFFKIISYFQKQPVNFRELRFHE